MQERSRAADCKDSWRSGLLGILEQHRPSQARVRNLRSSPVHPPSRRPLPDTLRWGASGRRPQPACYLPRSGAQEIGHSGFGRASPHRSRRIPPEPGPLRDHLRMRERVVSQLVTSADDATSLIQVAIPGGAGCAPAPRTRRPSLPRPASCRQRPRTSQVPVRDARMERGQDETPCP